VSGQLGSGCAFAYGISFRNSQSPDLTETFFCPTCHQRMCNLKEINLVRHDVGENFPCRSIAKRGSPVYPGALTEVRTDLARDWDTRCTIDDTRSLSSRDLAEGPPRTSKVNEYHGEARSDGEEIKDARSLFFFACKSSRSGIWVMWWFLARIWVFRI